MSIYAWSDGGKTYANLEKSDSGIKNSSLQKKNSSEKAKPNCLSVHINIIM